MKVGAVLAVMTGCLIGGAVAYYGLGDAADTGPSADNGFRYVESIRTAVRRMPGGAQLVPVSERLAAYRTAAAMSNVVAVETALRHAAESPRTALAAVEIEAFLARLTELDPSRAVALADSLRLDERLVAGVIQLWAQADADAALRALADIGNSDARYAAALGLSSVVAGDFAGFEQLAAVLPATDRLPFTVEWIARRAEDDPSATFREILNIRDLQAQRTALGRVARVWARRDPADALSRAGSLPEALQAEYRRTVSDEWARLDLAEFLSYVEASPIPEAFFDTVSSWGIADPDGLLRVASRVTGALGEQLSALAIVALAERDPEAALARLETMPRSFDREQMLSHVAVIYAKKDAESALAWLDSMSPAPVNLQAGVLSAVVDADPERALELLGRLPPSVELARFVMSTATSRASDDPVLAARLADGFLERGDMQAVSALSDLLSSWLRQDPDGALGWIAASSRRLDESVLRNTIRELASRDPRAAASYVDRVPSPLRDDWIGYVAPLYARNDPSGALSWISYYRGQEAYDPVVRQVIMQSAQSEPEAAAILLTQSSRNVQLAAAPSVAAAWAAQDPQGAVLWAQSLGDGRVRALAVERAVASWASRDDTAAERWVIGLPEGETRDHALGSLLSRRAASGSVDRRLLDAFSSDGSRQRVLASQMSGLARRNPDEAQDLLDEYVSDAALRQQVQAVIDSVRGGNR